MNKVKYDLHLLLRDKFYLSILILIIVRKSLNNLNNNKKNFKIKTFNDRELNSSSERERKGLARSPQIM